MPLLFTLLLCAHAPASVSFRPVIARPRAALAQLDPTQAQDLPRILDAVSAALVGRPYLLGPLGEGADEAHPLYRLDAFDCTTFLETVLANAYCFRDRSASCLENRMRRIRYAGGRVSFATRNHVPELDWLPQNEANGFLSDLSGTAFPGEWKTATPKIDRSLWLASKGEPGTPEPPVRKLAYLPVAYFFRKAELKPEEWAALDAKLAAEKRAAETEADPKARERKRFRADLAWLRAAYVAIPERLARIPSGTVLNLVRAPEKDPARARLTPLVSHQGLIVQKPEGPRLRHAAANVGHVSDQSLADYLLRFVRSAHFRGIALFRVLPSPTVHPRGAPSRRSGSSSGTQPLSNSSRQP